MKWNRTFIIHGKFSSYSLKNVHQGLNWQMTNITQGSFLPIAYIEKTKSHHGKPHVQGGVIQINYWTELTIYFLSWVLSTAGLKNASKEAPSCTSNKTSSKNNSTLAAIKHLV